MGTRRHAGMTLLLAALLSSPLLAAGQGEAAGPSEAADPVWQARFEEEYAVLAEEEQPPPEVSALVADRLPPEARQAAPELAARLAMEETLRAEERLRRGEPVNRIALQAQNRLRRELGPRDGDEEGSGARVRGSGEGRPPELRLPQAASNRALEALEKRRGPREELRGRGRPQQVPRGVSVPGRPDGSSSEDEDRPSNTPGPP